MVRAMNVNSKTCCHWGYIRHYVHWRKQYGPSGTVPTLSTDTIAIQSDLRAPADVIYWHLQRAPYLSQSLMPENQDIDANFTIVFAHSLQHYIITTHTMSTGGQSQQKKVALMEAKAIPQHHQLSHQKDAAWYDLTFWRQVRQKLGEYLTVRVPVASFPREHILFIINLRIVAFYSWNPDQYIKNHVKRQNGRIALYQVQGQ